MTGPKGCGKTFTLAATFVACVRKGECCIFLSQKSLEGHLSCLEYFQNFVKARVTTANKAQKKILSAFDDQIGKMDNKVQMSHCLQRLFAHLDKEKKI